jgi:hypothetical protein
MNSTPKRQPRERAVACRAGHDRRNPVETWNVSGLCDEHEARLYRHGAGSGVHLAPPAGWTYQPDAELDELERAAYARDGAEL